MDMLLLAVKAHLNPPKMRQVVIDDCLQSRTCLNNRNILAVPGKIATRKQESLTLKIV